MTYQKLLQQAQIQAVEHDKEESAAYLLLEHVTGLETNQLYAKITTDAIFVMHANNLKAILTQILLN